MRWSELSELLLLFLFGLLDKKGLFDWECLSDEGRHVHDLFSLALQALHALCEVALNYVISNIDNHGSAHEIYELEPLLVRK